MSRTQRFKVRVDGVEHEVEVALDPDASTTRVWIDGRPHEVVDAPDGALLVRGEEGGTQRAVWLEPGPAPGSAHSSGSVFGLEVQTAQQAALREAMSEAGHAGNHSALVQAPMPGRVVRVLVQSGDDVELDDPVIIVEAMKMENEVRATASGLIAEIAVAAGDTVEAGQLLCEIAPHAEDS